MNTTVNRRSANEDTEPAIKIPRSSPSSTDDAIAQSGTGLRHTLHGDIFQLKLLMLFLVRGIHLKYSKFQLGTEMPGQGGKFDDLVFFYQDAPRGDYRYRFLQAKHKQNNNESITAKDLRNESDKDFSLQKYFRSYRKEIANRGKNVQDCVICTNIGFDEELLESQEFNLTLIETDDKILAMPQEPNFDKVPARYKLTKTPQLVELLSSDLHYLAKKLLEFIKVKRKLTLKVDIFKVYHAALVKEKVIERKEKNNWTFHQNFIDNLSPNAIEFHQAVFELWSKANKSVDYPEFTAYLQASTFTSSDKFGQELESSDKKLDDSVTENEINEFLDKLVFAVDIPDEVRLGNILTKEVGQHFNLRQCEFQSSFILEKMLDWFKKKQGTVMLTELNDKMSEGNHLFEQTRRKMVALRATAFSIDFGTKYLPPFFRENLQFQEATIAEKANQLEQFLNGEEQVLLISTPSLRCTTLKVMTSMERLPRFKGVDDGYLLIKSKHLGQQHIKEWVQVAMKEDHEVLIVVGKNAAQFVGSCKQELMPEPKKKMIFIFSETGDFERDEIDCKLLRQETINTILSTSVTFQGSEVTIDKLVGDGLNEILDSSSIEEIFFHQRKLNIPPFDCHQFEKSLWIERTLLPLRIDNGRANVFHDKCNFHPETNHIEWLVENEDEKSRIWEQVQQLFKNKTEHIKPQLISPSIGGIPEDMLVKQSISILTGVAGSGKSTILSRHYERVKMDNSNVWAIKINLINHSKYFSEIPFSQCESTSSAVDILINLPGVTSHSCFARSLLKNRINNYGGIVLMLDGFDEVNWECQKNIIGLIKALSKTKLDRLIITTRPHLTVRLQDELFQFALSLENLGKDHQIKYLTQYWQKKAIVNNVELTSKFANSLIEWVSEALKDKETTFIGIPLQCRILAECFQSQLEISIEQDALVDFVSEIGPNYNVAQLYRMLFKKKADIFRREKATGSKDFDLIVKWAMDEFLQTLDSYHLKLAIDTIFEKNDVDLLWPPQQLSNRQYNEEKMQEKMSRHSLQFGLTSCDSSGKLEFLHRTFAEYMVAEFLYKGFLSEENKDKDEIRDSDGPLRDFMVHHILVDNTYEGVRVFLDSMLKDMVTTDKTWRDTIQKSINQSKPNQLQRFAQHVSFSMLDYLSNGSGADSLLKAISEGNVGIFDLMVDCLAAIYDRKSVQEIVGKAINSSREIFFSFFSCSVEIHQRVVNFLRDADDSVLNGLLKLMKQHFPFADAKCHSNFARKPYLSFLLDFMEKHTKIMQKLFSQAEFQSYKLLVPAGFFIFDEHYDDELRRFIKLQVVNEYFVDNLDYGGTAMSSRNDNWKNGNIEKILSLLQDLKQDKILETMRKSVLTSNPELYEQFYGTCILDDITICQLHQSASRPTGDRSNAISKLMWQFLAAAVVGNEDICENMLQILSTGQDWNWIDEGFIYYDLQDSIKSCRTDMFTLIVRVVRRHFDQQSGDGQKALRHVLTLQESDLRENPLIKSFDHVTLNEIIQMKIIGEEDGSDLFSNVLLGTERPSEKHFEEGFSLLLQHVLAHFSQHQLINFIQLITTTKIWAYTMEQAKSAYDLNCDHFLTLVASRLDQQVVKNLLLHEEGNVVVLYLTALTNGDKNLVNKMCTRHLSQENGDILLADFYAKAPDIILNMFDEYSKEMRPHEKKIEDLIHFFVDHAANEQLLRLVDIVTVEGANYWDYLFLHLSDKTILKVLTKVSELNEIISEQTTKKLLTIDNIRGPSCVIIRAAQQKGQEFVEAINARLSETTRNEMSLFLKCNAPGRIEEMFFFQQPQEIRWNDLNFFLNHCNDRQLSKFVNVITTYYEAKSCSIWGNCIEEIAKTSDNWSEGSPRAEACRQLENYLEIVKIKLGEDSVKELLLHNDGHQQEKQVIFIRIVLLYTGTLSRNEFTSRFTIKVLSPEKHEEFRLQLDPVTDQLIKDKSTSCYSSDEWMRALHFYLDYSFDPNLSTTFFLTITYKHEIGPKRKKTSIWEYLFMDLVPEVVSELSRLLCHIKEKLGEDILKNLALEKDEVGRFILGEALRTHAYANHVKNMYAYLSTEIRNEVFAILLNDPYLTNRLNVEIGSRSFSDNSNGELLMYFKHVRTRRQIGDRQCSMWTHYVGKIGQTLTIEKFEQFLKLIFDKLGEEYLKELALHDDGDGESILSRAISQEEDSKLDAVFSLLSPSSQIEIRHKAYTTPGMMEQMLSRKGSDYWIRRYLKISSANGTASNLHEGFNLFASHFLDKLNLDQLKQFVLFVTSLNKVEAETRSIWGDYVKKVCSISAVEGEKKEWSVSSIDRFFNVVSNRLGATAVVHQLLYHYDGNRVVINYLAQHKEVAEMIHRHLEQHEKSAKIQFCPIDGRPEKEQLQPTLQQQMQQRGRNRGKKQKGKK